MALIYKDFSVDLSGVKDSDKEEVKKKIANLLYDEVLRHVGKGKSPVQGEPEDFKTLNTKYAKREKQGNKKPNLQLEGDLMRDDFDTQVLTEGDVIRVGHFDASTADTEGEKADGHNQHTSKAQAWAASMENPFPKRRYIPSDAQTFRSDVIDKVENLISKFRPSDSLDIATDIISSILSKETGKIISTRQEPDITEVGLEDYLSDDYIARLIGDRLNNG